MTIRGLDMLRAALSAFAAMQVEWAARSECAIRDGLATAHVRGLFDGRRILGSATFHRRAAHRAEVLAVYLRPGPRRRAMPPA